MGERHAAVAAVTFVKESYATAKDLRVLYRLDHPAKHGDETCIVPIGCIKVTGYPETKFRFIREDHASVTVALYAVLKQADLDVVCGQLDLAILPVAFLTDASGEVSTCFDVAERQHCTACQSESGKGLGVEVRARCCVIVTVSHVAVS